MIGQPLKYQRVVLATEERLKTPNLDFTTKFNLYKEKKFMFVFSTFEKPVLHNVVLIPETLEKYD